MKNFIKDMKNMLLKPVVKPLLYTTLLLPILYSGCKSETDDAMLSELKKNNVIAEKQYQLDSARFTKENPGYVVSYPGLAETNDAGDTAFYAGYEIPIHEVENEYLSSNNYPRDVMYNGVACETKEGIDRKIEDFDRAQDSLRVADSLAASVDFEEANTTVSKHNNHSHSTYTKHASVKNNAVSNTNTTKSVLDSIGEYVDQENISALGVCDTCVTREQLLFKAVNENYKNK